MAFPDRPDFNSGADDSAWWRTRLPGQRVALCRTTGNTFVRLVQDTLRNGGASDVVSDAIWGPATQRALATQLAAQGAPQVLVDAARTLGAPGAIRRGQAINAGVVAGAIWLLHRAGLGPVPAGLAAQDLVSEPNLRGPLWLQAPPLLGIPTTGVFCSVQGVEDPTQQPETPGQPPTNIPPAPPSGTPPPAEPPRLPPLPPGVNIPPPARAESSVKWGYVAAIGGTLAVLGAMALSGKKSTGRSSGKGRR